MFEYDKKSLDAQDTEVFVVGLECFWGVEARFASIDGVVRTSCGYSGGSGRNPSYNDIMDHTETVRVEYDASVTSYRELVDFAIEIHNPNSKNRKRQYDNVIFYSDNEEKDILEKTIENKGYSPENIETRLERLDEYYFAENYHQKYKLRSRRTLEQQFMQEYTEEEFRDSALATKMNAVVAGNLDTSELPVSDELDLTEDLFSRIIERFR